jgi:outer membrane protein assembly factor BamB
VIVRTNGREELLLNGDAGITSYNPTTGEQLWFCKGFNGRGEPTVTPGKELVYLVNGKPGDIYAVQPGGQGDVTASRMAWHTTRRSGRDLPSPVLIGNHLLVVSMNGILTCYDSVSGKILFNERLGGNYSASPIVVNGLAYFQSEEGPVVVVQPGPELNVVARNTVDPSSDEIFRGSPAAPGRFFCAPIRPSTAWAKRNWPPAIKRRAAR